MYVSYGLPAFYVQVRFTEDTPGTTFVGGETHPNFVALTIYHIARAFKSDESKQRFLADVDAILNLVFESKGMDWEYWITEVSRDLWKLNGLVPPPTGSEGEKKWAEIFRNCLPDYSLKNVAEILERKKIGPRMALSFGARISKP